MGVKFNPFTANFDLVNAPQDLSGFVPYVGASQNVDLGSNSLITEGTIKSSKEITLPGFDTFDLYGSIGEHWTFDDTLEGYKNSTSLTERNDSAVFTDGVNSKRNKAVFFNGGRCLSTSDKTYLSYVTPFSVSFWIKSTSTFVNPVNHGTGTGNGWIVRYLDAFGQQTFFLILHNGSTFQYVQAVPSGNTAITDWVHCAVSVDTINKNIVWYLNGVQTNFGSYTGNISATASDFVIGGDSTFSGSANTYMDEFTYFQNKILTAQEVEDIFNEGTPLEPEETQEVQELKLVAKSFIDGQFLQVVNNEISPVFGVDFDDDTQTMTIPELKINPLRMREGVLDISAPFSDVGRTIYFNAQKEQMFMGRSDRFQPDASKAIILSDNDAIYSSDIQRQVSVGFGNIIANDDTGGSRFIYGAGNQSRVRSSSIFGGNNIDRNTDLINKGSNILLGTFNTTHGFVTTNIGSGNIIGRNAAGGGRNRSIVLGVNLDSNAHDNITIGISPSTKLLNDVEKSFLVAFFDSGQKNLIQAVANNGVRIGALTGESITMTGDDLFVAGHAEIKEKVYALDDVELTTAEKGVILKSPNGTRYRLTVDNDGNLVTTAL